MSSDQLFLTFQIAAVGAVLMIGVAALAGVLVTWDKRDWL